MRDLALIGLMMSGAALPGCTEKGNDTEGATESSGTTESTASSGSTEPGSTTGSSGESSTTREEPTTGSTATTGSTGETTEDSTGSTTAPLDEDCAFLIGKKFISKQQWPCGPPMDPNDPGELCPDEVSFTEDGFFYQSGDFGVGGDYTCAAGKITAGDEFETYSGEIDAGTGVLVWEGSEFLPE